MSKLQPTQHKPSDRSSPPTRHRRSLRAPNRHSPRPPSTRRLHHCPPCSAASPRAPARSGARANAARRFAQGRLLRVPRATRSGSTRRGRVELRALHVLLLERRTRARTRRPRLRCLWLRRGRLCPRLSLPLFSCTPTHGSRRLVGCNCLRRERGRGRGLVPERAVAVLGDPKLLREAQLRARGDVRDVEVHRVLVDLRERVEPCAFGAVGGVREHEDAAERARLDWRVRVHHALREGLRDREGAR